MTPKSKEDKLAELVQELYAEYDRIVIPTFPKIFIRVLPRELTYGSLILPGNQQNKTMWEGVVLSTYKPFWKVSEWATESEAKKHLVQSDLCPGDHIVFPYYVGLPDPVFDEKKYRIIKEEDISCVLRYDRQNPKDLLEGWFAELGNGLSYEGMLERIMETYELVPKSLTSKTRSGIDVSNPAAH